MMPRDLLSVVLYETYLAFNLGLQAGPRPYHSMEWLSLGAVGKHSGNQDKENHTMRQKPGWEWNGHEETQVVTSQSLHVVAAPSS